MYVHMGKLCGQTMTGTTSTCFYGIAWSPLKFYHAVKILLAVCSPFISHPFTFHSPPKILLNVIRIKKQYMETIFKKLTTSHLLDHSIGLVKVKRQ